jgi:cation diffusion facilitator CzcD-associated flavoprotein CzcO
VIVGGGFGGLTAARELHKADVEVTLRLRRASDAHESWSTISPCRWRRMDDGR